MTVRPIATFASVVAGLLLSSSLSLSLAADCNKNGVEDALDLSGATSRDCNTNAVPDECDISGGISLDCNTNGTLDECDLAAAAPRQIAKLLATDAAADDEFGNSVSVSGDTAVIGAFRDDDGGSASGSAYVFREIAGSWQQIAKLTAADAAAGDWFGHSVSVSGNTAVIGVRLDDGHGSAYIFREVAGSWQQIAKLTAADAALGDAFGVGVSVSGRTAVIGAAADDDGGTIADQRISFAKSPVHGSRSPS